jgi:hypothetical protein
VLREEVPGAAFAMVQDTKMLFAKDRSLQRAQGGPVTMILSSVNHEFDKALASFLVGRPSVEQHGFA